MFKMTFLAVGKLKEKHWKDAQDEFLRRLSPFAKTELIEVAAEPFGGSVTAAQSMRAEGTKLLKRIPEDAEIIALERTGKAMSSVDFARMIEDLGGAGRHLAFVIGGAAGLDAAVLAKADRKISMSAMTYTHEMARIILLEQAYRAMTILTGKPYHL
jgi:23S rRNA (pseudouridine1915-N3)-methyltransferase